MMNAMMSKPLAERKSPRPSVAPVATGDPALQAPSLPGAPADFGALYSEHSPPIYYLALRFLGDPQKAEDAAHDVFLKAFRKMDQFRGESSWRTWLYRITINHCRHLQQSWHERHVLTSPDGATGDATPAA